MLLCLHEEAAVAIAHGYAKVTGKAMAAAVHSNVGLFHATMAIFNAWCDRMPILILGATGPVDAMKRRPWIDWIHTAADQGADHPQLHQVGRPAGIGRRRPRVGAARLLDVEHRAVRADLHQPRCRGAGRQAAGAAAADRRQALHAAGGPGSVGRSGQEGGRHSAERQEAADPGRPPVAQGRGLEEAHRTRRSARRASRHQSQDRRGVPDRSSAAHRLSGDLRHRRPDRRGEGRRRHPEPRLGRSRRHLQGHRRRAIGDRDPGLARPEPAQRLEHGLRGPAGGGPVHPGRIRRDRRGAGRRRRRARASRRSRTPLVRIR